MSAPELNPNLLRALDLGAPHGKVVAGEGNTRRYRAAVQFMRTSDLVRVSHGALGASATIEARQDLDREGKR